MEERQRGSQRLRGFTYPERKRFPLRLSRRLYDALTEASAASALTTTAYVSAVLEVAVASSTAADARSRRKRRPKIERQQQDPEVVTLSLRLLPKLFTAVQSQALERGMSMNMFVVHYIEKSLFAGGKD